MRTIVADENIDIRQQAEAALAEAGYQVTVAENGSDLLGTYHDKNPDLVLVSQTLSQKNGLECLEWIRGQENGGDVKVFVIGETVDMEFMKASMPLNLDGFIQKPITSEALIEQISKIAPCKATENQDINNSSPNETIVAGQPELKAESTPTKPPTDTYKQVVPDDIPDMEIPAGDSNAQKCPPLKVSEHLLRAAQAQLQTLTTIIKLERERQAILDGDEEIDERVKGELKRQSMELRQIPDAETVKGKMTAFATKIAAYRSQVTEGEAPAPSQELEDAWVNAQEQWNLFIEHDELYADVTRAALSYAANEPLYQILKRFKFPADKMFAYMTYALALEALKEKAIKQRKVIREKIQVAEEKSTGLLRKLRSSSEDEKLKDIKIEQDISDGIDAIFKENESLQTVLSKEFWKLYELSACLIFSGKLDKEETCSVRCFLRYGLISAAPWMITPSVAEWIRKDCTENVFQPDSHDMNITHIYYPDEYLFQVSTKRITPAVDEDLELHMRNTPEWSADKSERRIIFSKFMEASYREIYSNLRTRESDLRNEAEFLENERLSIPRKAKDYKQLNNELGHKVQFCKVEAGRMMRACERIQEKFLPNTEERKSMAEEKLIESGINQTVFDITRRQVAQIHRVTRLCAKLKDPFLPFILRDNFKVDTNVLNTRAVMLKDIGHIEKCDPTIFKDPIMQVKKVSHRIYIRHSPVVLLTPGMGFIGFSWNSRGGVENGKLVFPGYLPRRGLREGMLHSMFADFRWDTSKADAGVDVLTSETLVGAYATVRWEYRKRSKEIREKSLIFTEMPERTNWRRHYDLYLQSALDGGKKLFFKCNEVYELVVKYLGLPEGVEKLKK